MCIYVYTYISVLVICLFTAIHVCLCKDYNRVSKNCKQFSLIFVLCDHLGESKSSERLLLVTDVSTTWAAVIFSLSEDYSHPADHTKQTTDTPGFKLFTKFSLTCFLLSNIVFFSILPYSL